MKLFLKTSCLIYLLVLITTSGCKKTLDINTSPNVPGVEQANAKLVFPSAVMATAAQVGGEYAILGAIWGQYATQSAFANQYRTWEQYNLTGLDFERAYEGLFVRALPNYQLIINQAREQKNWNFFLMATVMKAYTAQVLVDLYGDIPFTEALQGAGNLTPKFDDGYTIYKSLLDSLDAALAKDFTASTNIPGGHADLVFPGSGSTDVAADADWISSGNINKWIQFANTLELKMYLRMVNKKPTEAQAGIQKLYTAGAQFLSVDAGVGGFKSEPGLDNPMYEQNIQGLNTSTNLRASYTLASFLQGNGDPRITYFYGSTSPISMHQGDYLNTSSTYGSAATLVQRATDPVMFISAAESYFLQAEARERYFGGAGAKALYDLGVQTSFVNMGSTVAAANTLLAGAYAYPTSGTLAQKIEAIITQKWISFGYGVHYLEGYLEKNRTGYPKTSPVYSTDPSYVPGQFVVSKNSVLGPGLFGKRLPYPNEERTGNPNTPASVPLSTPVWWSL
jgi:hypothetical protein